MSTFRTTVEVSIPDEAARRSAIAHLFHAYGGDLDASGLVEAQRNSQMGFRVAVEIELDRYGEWTVVGATKVT